MAKTAESAGRKSGLPYPPGWEDLSDDQKEKMAKSATDSAHNGFPVEPNSLAAFAIAWTVEQSLHKPRKKKNRPIVGTAGVNNKFAEEDAKQEDAAEAA